MFSIFSFVFFLLLRSQVTFSKLVPLACSLKPLTLLRLDWKSLSFLLILSYFLQHLFLIAITKVSLWCFNLIVAALKFSGNIFLNFLSNLSSIALDTIFASVSNSSINCLSVFLRTEFHFLIKHHMIATNSSKGNEESAFLIWLHQTGTTVSTISHWLYACGIIIVSVKWKSDS